MLGLAKYPGSKQRVAQRILRCLPPVFDAYVEPFCGNAPFLQPQFHHYLDPSRHQVWLNDLCIDVVNVLRSLKDDPESFIDQLMTRKDRCRTTAETIREFHQAKQDWIETEDPVAYLFLRRLAVAHIVLRKRPSRCSISPKYVSPTQDGVTRNGMRALTRERMEVAARLAQDVDKVTCVDFREVLSNLPDRCVIYLDPPYWTRSVSDWYDHVFTQQDHFDLADILRSLDPSRHKFLMTVEISELSKTLYVLPDCFNWQTLDITYCVPCKGTRRVKELLVSNYDWRTSSW